jgi:hypothetical protein
MSVNLETVERTMEALAAQSRIPFIYADPANGERITVSPAVLASRSGYLPAIVGAGEAIWREATGNGFALDVARDPEALLGYRLKSIDAGTFTSVMLSALEALHQAARPTAVIVSDLNAIWSASRLRTEPASQPTPAPSSGMRP